MRATTAAAPRAPREPRWPPRRGGLTTHVQLPAHLALELDAMARAAGGTRSELVVLLVAEGLGYPKPRRRPTVRDAMAALTACMPR